MQRILYLLLTLWLAVPGWCQHGAGGGSFGGGAGFGGRGRDNSGGDELKKALLAIGFAGLATLLAWILDQWVTRVVGLIRITEVPPGEATLEIRQAWVGICVPTIRRTANPRLLPIFGVLSKNHQGYTKGYQIPGREAIAALEKHDPEAARWWRANAFYTCQSNYYFVIPSSCSIRIPADAA